MYSSIMGPINTQLHNLNLMLKLIKAEGPISRADIARSLKCSKSTVTVIIGQLIEYGLIREIGKGNPATGRKSTLLEFNPKAKFVIAVDSRPDYSRLAVMDLSGGIELALELAQAGTDPASFTRRLIEGIAELIAKSKLDKDQFVAVGIMVSGIVDPGRGKVLYSALMDWEEAFDLAAPIQDATGIPVFLGNDVNALALAELWLGCGQSASSIAYLYLDRKIGGAYVDEGFVIQGADYAFAELGKIIIAGDKGPEQLESRLAIPSLLERFGIAIEAERSGGMELRAELAHYLALNPELRAHLLEFLLDALGQAVSSIVAILNPGTIILGGFSYFDPPFIERLTARARSLLPRLPHRTISIVTACINGRDEILGAAAIAIVNTRFKFLIQG
jgi:predicted NBD/HSP70 family sugar kinase